MHSLKKSKKILRKHKGGSRTPFNTIAKYETDNSPNYETSQKKSKTTKKKTVASIIRNFAHWIVTPSALSPPKRKKGKKRK
jgi:hypothetical protein